MLTHHARAPIEMEGSTTFHCVTDGIHRALARGEPLLAASISRGSAARPPRAPARSGRPTSGTREANVQHVG